MLSWGKTRISSIKYVERHDSLGPKAVVAAVPLRPPSQKRSGSERLRHSVELRMLRSKEIRRALGLNHFRSAANTKALSGQNVDVFWNCSMAERPDIILYYFRGHAHLL